MDLVSSLSATLWDLLQRTRLRADVALELFDSELRPLLPASDDPRSLVVRCAASIRFFASAEISFRTVIQSGRDARMSIEDWDLTLLPIRENQQPVALLVAATARVPERAPAEWVTPAPGEAAARAWRDAIEGDLVSRRRLSSQEQLTHRSRALATFVADLQQSADEGELLNSLLQAIAVWHDVEPSAYTRDLAGYFGLRATLPGADVSALPTSLEAGAVLEATAQRSGEWPVRAHLGWRGRGTPLLLLVSSGSLEEWLIVITGCADADLPEQLQPMLRGFAAAMEQVREREARQLRQQLWEAMVGWNDPFDHSGLARELLRVLARAVGATHAILSVAGEAEREASAAAVVGRDGDNRQLVRDGYFTADALRVSFPLGMGRVASIELRRSDGGWFRPQDVTACLGVRPLVGSWLLALRDDADWNASIGLQESSRVLRFGETSTSALT